MVTRKGMGKGRGKGFKNIIGKDPKTHSDSAKGRKQPQQINPVVNRIKRPEKEYSLNYSGVILVSIKANSVEEATKKSGVLDEDNWSVEFLEGDGKTTRGWYFTFGSDDSPFDFRREDFANNEQEAKDIFLIQLKNRAEWELD